MILKKKIQTSDPADNSGKTLIPKILIIKMPLSLRTLEQNLKMLGKIALKNS